MFQNWIKTTLEMCWIKTVKIWDSRLLELSVYPLNILSSWTFYIENKTMLISPNLILSSAITTILLVRINNENTEDFVAFYIATVNFLKLGDINQLY